MILFHPNDNGTYSVFPSQEGQLASNPMFTADLGSYGNVVPLEDMSIYKKNTVLVSSDITPNVSGEINAGNVRVLAVGTVIYQAGNSEKPTNEQAQYFLNYLQDNGTDRSEIINYFNQLKAYKYNVVNPVDAIPAAAPTAPANTPVDTTPLPADKVINPGDVQIYRTILERIKAEFPCPTVKDDGFWVEETVWLTAVRNILRRKNTIFTGPTGSGKTELAELLASKLGKELFYQDMGAVQDVQSSLMGVHRIDGNGHSMFEYAPFVQHIQKPGVMVIEEINRGPIASGNVFFPALDNRRYVPVDIAGEHDKRHIPIHEDLVFFATANLGSEYSGTSAIDRALLNRFFQIELDYPPMEVEIAILKKKFSIDHAPAKQIVKLANAIREEASEGRLTMSVSVRETQMTAELVADGFKLDDAIYQVFLPMFDKDGGDSSERKTVKALISRG